MRRASLALFAFVAALGCHRPTTPASPVDGADVSATDPPDATPAPAPTVLVARCHPVDPSWSLGARGASETGDLEIGDAVASHDGEAVAIVHRTDAGRVAAVALLEASPGSDPSGSADPDRASRAARIVDLGPTLGDAPPPRLVPRASDLLAAAYGVPRAGDTRTLVLYSVNIGANGAVGAADAATSATTWLEIPQQRDDSLAFDLAYDGTSGVVAWDEATGAGRGVIRIASLTPDRRSSPPRDVSPPQSDAELPRVVPSSTGSGFFVLWIARRPEAQASVDASELEAPGEARTYGWIEMVSIDEHGAVAGPVRRLTSVNGHVSTYDVEPLAAAHTAKPGTSGGVLVVARDDGEETDGSGGAIVRVRVMGDSITPPVDLATDGLGRGAPTFVDADPPWLAWIGPHEQLRLVPLDGSGTPLATPSAEDALNDARPLRLVPGKDDAHVATMLVAAPSNASGELRTFACSRARDGER